MTDRTVVYRLQAEASQFKAQMAAASASVRKAAGDMTAADKDGEKFRRGLDSLGGTAGKVGLVAAVGLGAAVKKAADFDQAMSNVQAATHESAAAMESLREAALKAGADTAFSATEAAAGIENLAKAGISTEDILGGALAGALDLAAAGGMEVADAAEAAAGAMAQFKLDGSEATHVADLLAAGAGKAQGDVSDMVFALKQAGTVSAQTGLTIEETTGALAAMAEQSLLGSDAGTSFKTMLAALTPNSDKAAEAMDRYNISAFDAQGNFVGMTELAGQLEQGLGKLTDEQRAVALETIFGSDAVRAASIIYDNGAEGIAKWTENVNDAGYAAETAEIKLDNLSGDLEALGGSLETALIGTGSGAQGPLRSLTQTLTDVVNAYNNLGDAAKSGVAITLGATAALGGGLFVFSKVIQGVSNTRAAMSNLGVTSDAVKGKLGGFVSFLGGPWGLAMMTATVLLGDYMSQQAKSKGYVDSLTAALDDQTGAATRNAIASNLQEEGWLEYAQSVGVGADVVIDAALGSAEAMQVLKDATADEGGFWSTDITGDADQFIKNVEAQAKAQKQAETNSKLLAEANKENAEATETTSVATEGLEQAMVQAQKQTKAQAEALKKAREAAYETAESFVNLGDGVDDAKVSLNQWIKQLANQADVLNNFMDNAKKASKRGLRDGLIQDLQDAGQAGAMRMRQLANATDSEIAKANQAWKRGQDAMERYVDFKVPAKRVEVDTGAAISAISVIRNALKNIPDESVVVRVTRSGTGAQSPGFGPQANAAGGYISGPGTATSDSIPAYLSNGEYVIKAAAVDKYGTHMFDHLNAMRFADGGSVEKKPPKRSLNFAVGGADTIKELNQFVRQQEAIFAAQLEAAQGLQQAASDQQSAAKSSYDAAVAQRDAAGKAAVSGFNTGLFDTREIAGDPIWGAGAMSPRTEGGWLSNLSTDIAGLAERQSLVDQLSAQGIQGTTLAALLAEGTNADISGLIASGQVGQFAAMYGQREALQGSVAASAGNAAFGEKVAVMANSMAAADAKLAQINTETAKVERQLERANRQLERQAEQFAEALNNAAAKGHRDKKNGGR